MKRRRARTLAVLLACALPGFGQNGFGQRALGQTNPKPPEPADASSPVPWVVDTIALDTSGLPVTGLTAADFELAQGGQSRKITNFTWFDTRLHRAVSPPDQLPALAVAPDEIHRYVVLIVDDLGLSPEGVDASRRALRDFVNNSMLSGDLVAILRSSGGSGVLQQLTADRKLLAQAIDEIQPLGGVTGSAAAGSGAWEALLYALSGLSDYPGRKQVVVFSQNPDAIAPRDSALSEALHAAHAAGAAVFAVDPVSGAGSNAGSPTAHQAAGAARPSSALETLARETGGWHRAVFARLLEQEQGYYAIGFQPDEGAGDPSGRWLAARPAELKVRRPGVVLRARAGYIRQVLSQELTLAPLPLAERLEQAVRSPFAGGDIPARLAAGFSASANGAPALEATLHFDVRNITFLHDLQGGYHAKVILMPQAHSDNGSSTALFERALKIDLSPAQYRVASEHGMSFSFQLKLPGPGPWQFRTVVADGSSDRIGSATRFVEIPNLRQGEFSISGLTLRGTYTDEGIAAEPDENLAIRIFKPGRDCIFSFDALNAEVGEDRQSAIEMRARILYGGDGVVEGAPAKVTYAATAGGRRQIRGKLVLPSGIRAGNYLLTVTVRDLLAPAARSAPVTRFIDFKVRP